VSGRAEVAVDSPGPAASGSAWPRPLLTPLAWAYGLAVRARNRAYETGRLRVHRLPCRVIAIGNLALGGTGKTPMAIAVAQALQGAGRRVAILIRGYRGTAAAEVAVVSDGARVGMDARQAGDEAVLLAHRLPGVPVIRGADRVAAGQLAIARFGAEALVLDDGFQHRRIARDLDLLLLDARDPFAGGALLPAGCASRPPPWRGPTW
jgi:tetraacyldisaccharide 4'-kinase